MNPAWFHRVEQEYRAGNLTAKAFLVLRQLAFYLGNRGEAWPSHETLAERAGCCVRTVQRALQAARDLGLVDWVERRVRAAWRWLRTSNLYRLLMPGGAVQPGLRGRPATTGQKDRGGEREAREGRSPALTKLLEAASGLPDLLAARREHWRARLAARWRHN